MSVGAANSNNSVDRAMGWKRILRSLGALTGLLGTGLGAATVGVVAQDADYRAAAAAPAAWQDFARRLQVLFQERLTADNAATRQFQDLMAKREGSAAPTTLVVRTWVLASGKLERIEFDGLDDDGIAVNLRAVLVGVDAGPPPADMLQPLHLRLSLRPNAKDQPARGN